jgi:hypothetical protein
LSGDSELERFKTVLHRDAQRVADELHDKALFDGPPLDPEELCASMTGLALRKDTLVGDGYLLEFSDGTGCVLVSDDANKLNRGRTAFTIAHEVGHWLLHRTTERNPDLARNASHDEVERWCDEFAASVLVPDRWLKSHFGAFEGLQNRNKLADGPARFGVSRETFVNRVADIYDVVVGTFDSEKRVRILSPNWLAAQSKILEQKIPHEKLIPGQVFGPINIRLADKQRRVLLYSS